MTNHQRDTYPLPCHTTGMEKWYLSLRIAVIGMAAIWVVQGITLWLFGQPAISASGHIMLWTGQVLGSENSQQITDWYTFSHVLHGILFYGLLWLIFPRMPVWWRLVLAMGIEVSWEILENTPFVINQYREQALAQGYSGDSILNSLSDTIAMIGGFFVARRLPVWGAVAVVLVFELFTMYMIRNGLFLNILGFIHHFDFITEWQMGL